MVGRVASGKSFFARQLAPRVYDLLLIDKDTLNNALLTDSNVSADDLARILLKHDSTLDQYEEDNQARLVSYISMAKGCAIPHESPLYKRIRLPSYWAMLKLAKENLELGKSVILDAPHIKELKIGYFSEVVPHVIPQLSDGTYDMKAIMCYASEAVLKQRVVARGNKHDKFMQLDEEAWRLDLQKEPTIPPEIEDYNHIKVDTSASSDLNLAKTLDFLVR